MFTSRIFKDILYFIGGIKYNFFPYYITFEMSHVMINVTVLENTTWELKNGRSASLKESTESVYQSLIVYPTLGYYLESSSRLHVNIKTIVESGSFKSTSLYTVEPASRLGQEYVVSTVTNNSKEYSCAVQAPFDKSMDITITLPVHLINKVYLNGQSMGASENNYRVPKGEGLKFNSSLPLHHVFIRSKNTSFPTFCAETNIRYQLLPVRHCGKQFRIVCELKDFYSFCNASLTTTIDDYNLLTVENSNGLKKQQFYNGYFYSLHLESGQNLVIKSQKEMCVLLSKIRHEDNKEWRHVHMISSSNGDFSSTIIVPSTGVHKVSNPDTSVQVNDRTPKYSADLQAVTKGMPLYSKSGLFTTSTTTIVRKTTNLSYVDKTTSGHDMRSQTTDWVYVWSKFAGALTNKTPPPLHHTMLSLSTGVPRVKKTSSMNKMLSTTQPVSKLLNTISKNNGCFCSFNEYCIESQQRVIFGPTLKSRIKHLKASLSVNKTSLNSFIRQKSCAEDTRPSSRSMGYVGVIVILLCAAFIVTLDLLTLCRVVSEPRHIT